MTSVQSVDERWTARLDTASRLQDEADGGDLYAIVVAALRAGLSVETVAAAADLRPHVVRAWGLSAGWPSDAPEAREMQRRRMLDELAATKRIKSV